MNYLICKWLGNENNAAVKAVEDVNTSFSQVGGKIIYLWKNNTKYVRNVEECLTFYHLKKTLNNTDNVIVQYPSYNIKPFMIEDFVNLPHKRMICFIQDFESYRYDSGNQELINQEIAILNKFDVIIAHNPAMITYFKEHGVTSKLINWEITDYIISDISIERKKDNAFSLCYVGNIKRSNFLREQKDAFKTRISVYGDLENSSLLTDNLDYKGIYNPNNLDITLEGNFGLIWEGNSLDTCNGVYGNYMKINNPNRLSLYIANNMPIVIWKKAALAKFVEENKIGITVDSLCEIDEILRNMSEKEYHELVINTKKIGKLVRSGYYAKKAIEEAIN